MILIRTGEFMGSSVVGDIFVGMARNGGVAAVVTDGVVRDIPGIDAVGIPVFARGVSPNFRRRRTAPAGSGAAHRDRRSGGRRGRHRGRCDRDGVVTVAARAQAAAGCRRARGGARQRGPDGRGRQGRVRVVPGWLEEAKRLKGVTYID
ncbi:MAG: hypothetical protein MZU95_04780 [Desulfomicrobium escambiense]|nr:hypothetical protein [Desulfomicrobium escambiense]